jgi:murein tripeptide amidase MpaA
MTPSPSKDAEPISLRFLDLLLGLQHAREWASIPPIQYTIDQLLSQSDPRAARYLKNYTFHIIPIMNPDGYEYSRNVDRNWHKSRCPSPPDELCRDPGVDRK